jgi:hypothetical protein
VFGERARIIPRPDDRTAKMPRRQRHFFVMGPGRPERLSKRFTDEEKAAIVRAVLDGGLSQLRALAAAEAGELDGVRPFKMSRAHLNGLVKRERRRRLVASGIESRAGELAGDVLDAAEAEMAKLKRKKKLTEKDHAQLRRLGGIARDLRAKPHAAQAAHNGNEGPPSFLQGLADEPQTPVVEPDPATPKPEPAPAAPPPPKPPQRPAPPTVDEVLADLDRQIGERRAAPTTLAQEAQATRERNATGKQIITGPRSSAALR